MPMISKTPKLVVDQPMSVIKGFVRVRSVAGGVACLNLGKQDLDYRGIIKVNTVNFALMSPEDQDMLIEGFKGFLNGISFPIQILIRNLPHNLNTYIRSFEAIQGEYAEMARDHAAFVRQLASRRALVKRSFFIVVPADHESTKNQTEALISAQQQIKLRIDELLRQLERLGLTGRRLNDEEIISLYQSCLGSDQADLLPVTKNLADGARFPMVSRRDRELATDLPYYANLEQVLEMPEPSEGNGKTRNARRARTRQKDATPDFGSLPDLLAPSSIQVTPWYLRIDGEAGQRFTRTLTFVSYPRSVYPGWLDAIIQLDEPFLDFSIHITPLNSQQVNARLGRKAVEFRGSVLVAHRQGRSPDPETTIALEDVEKMRENLARGDERIFNISLLIQVRAENRRELDERSSRVASTVRSLDFRVLPAHWQHHVALLSCLPDGDNPLGRGRLFGTSAASTFYPFTGGDISMDTGAMFGLLPNGGLVIINPFKSDELENANLVVFAKSGAGKSFFLKTVASRLLPSCNVYVVDPEAEYNTMCTRVHGQYVRLSSDSLQFNPFELYSQTTTTVMRQEDADEGNFFREKLLNLITLFELLLSDDGTLPQREKAFLYKCLVKAYENRGITLDRTTHSRPAPTMQEMYMIMTSASRGNRSFGVGEDIYGLSERLERYLHIFPMQTEITLDNRFVDFNIRELNDTLKPIGLFLITEFLWTKMRQARHALIPQPNTIILIDEAWLLMQFPQGAKFLAEFARRIRKYGGGLWCTTQNADDFLNAEEGRTILAMSTMKFLMKQDATTIESVMRTFRLSPGQRNALLAARRGEGLFATKSWIAMEVVASPVEAQMANTTIGSYTPPAVSQGRDLPFQPSVVARDILDEVRERSASSGPDDAAYNQFMSASPPNGHRANRLEPF